MNSIKVLDPRVAVRSVDETLHTILSGGARYQQKIVSASSWGDVSSPPTNATFTYNSNSDKNIVDRNIKLRCYLKVRCDQVLQVGQNDALRQYPLASIMDSLVVQINQASLDCRVADTIHALKCYQSWSVDETTAPTMPDAYQEYSDWATYGSGRNPLALYGECCCFSNETRGGFGGLVLDGDNKGFTAVITESIHLSPFANNEDVEGFANINEINFNIVWSSKLSRVLSHSALAPNLTNVAVTFYRAPELLVTEITQKMSVPRLLSQSLAYSKLQQFVKSYGVIPAGGTLTCQSDSFKLNQIPEKMYVYSRHNRNTCNENTSDSFLGVNALRVQWGTENLFSSATQQDLYTMSKKNGLNFGYSAFTKYRGAPLCVNFGSDIGLQDGEASGVRGVWTVSVECDMVNLSTQQFDAEFFVVFVYSGSIEISSNSATLRLGLLTPEDVLNSLQSGVEMPYSDYKHLSGGSFWSSLKNIVHKVASGVSGIAGVASKVASVVAPEFSPLISQVGRVAGTVGGLTGGGFSGGNLAGGNLSGGMMKRTARLR